MSNSQPNDPPQPPPKRSPRRREDSLPRGKSADPPPWHSFLHLGLTSRENEVLWWITQGKRNHEIALILGLSFRTIHRHVSNILGKLGVENRGSAVALALRTLSSPEP